MASETPQPHLLEFYGKECPPCIEMAPLVAELEKELGLTVRRYEVWHNEENARVMAEYDKGRCGGVPFLINTKTERIICGIVSYDELKAWALDTAEDDVTGKS